MSLKDAGIVAVSKTCFTMATPGILETLATKYPQVKLVKLDIFDNIGFVFCFLISDSYFLRFILNQCLFLILVLFLFFDFWFLIWSLILNQVDTVLLCGVEAHVCVHATACDFINRAFQVFITAILLKQIRKKSKKTHNEWTGKSIENLSATVWRLSSGGFYLKATYIWHAMMNCVLHWFSRFKSSSTAQ